MMCVRQLLKLICPDVFIVIGLFGAMFFCPTWYQRSGFYKRHAHMIYLLIQKCGCAQSVTPLVDVLFFNRPEHVWLLIIHALPYYFS